MRRALLVAAALAAPALAAAQTVTFFPDASVSVAECNPAANTTVDLTWTTLVDGAAAFPSPPVGEFRVYASNTPPPAAASGSTKAGYCYTTDSSPIKAGPIAIGTGTTIAAAKQPQTQTGVKVSDLFAAAGYTGCTSPTEEKVYVCVHWFASVGATTPTGVATGVLTRSFGTPGAPTAVRVTPGEKALHVYWTAPSGATAAKEYQAKATSTVLCGSAPCDSGGPYFSRKVSSSPADVTGLTNGVLYSVVVTAYSGAGNPGPDSTAVTGTPEPVADFFDYYKAQGGLEEGGCATGAAGALALLGAASVLALRRRSK